MSLITLLVLLVVFALLWYLFNNVLPIVEPWRTVINVVLILIAILMLLQAVGLVGGLRVS